MLAYIDYNTIKANLKKLLNFDKDYSQIDNAFPTDK